MKFEAKSTLLALFFNIRWLDILTPWQIIVDTDEETITIRKRNYILIGVDEDVLAFRYIRRIKVDEHIFGADMEIKIARGNVKACSLAKKDCKRIKKILVDYNKTSKGKGIILA